MHASWHVASLLLFVKSVCLGQCCACHSPVALLVLLKAWAILCRSLCHMPMHRPQMKLQSTWTATWCTLASSSALMQSTPMYARHLCPLLSCKCVCTLYVCPTLLKSIVCPELYPCVPNSTHSHCFFCKCTCYSPCPAMQVCPAESMKQHCKLLDCCARTVDHLHTAC